MSETSINQNREKENDDPNESVVSISEISKIIPTKKSTNSSIGKYIY